MKRIISIIMIICMLIGFTSCVSQAEEKHMIKGEFFNSLIKAFNYYPLDGSDIDQTNDYKIEAQTIADWDLLPEEEAFKKLNSAITKEEAAIVCLNTIYIKKQGSVDDIKDAKLCNHPQEIADAVATGIVSVDSKGYFDGKKKLTYEECQEIITNTITAKVNGEYDEDAGFVAYAYGENDLQFSAADFSEDDYMHVEGYEESRARANEKETKAESVDKSAETSVSFLNASNNSPVTTTYIENIHKEYFNVKVSESLYNSKFSKLKKGDYIVYTGDKCLPKNFDLNDLKKNQMLPTDITHPFEGYFVSAKKMSNGYYNLTLEAISDREVMANSKIEGVTRSISTDGFEPIEKSVKIAGQTINVKIEPDSTGTALTATAEGEIKFSEKKYEKSEWMNATKTITVIASATMSNMTVTTNKMENFYKLVNNDIAYFKFTADTSESINLKTGDLRYVPPSNGNGHFASNFTRSRFTDGDGAKAIKVAKVNIPLPYGLSVTINVHLIINFRGEIHIGFSQQANGFEAVRAKNGELHVCPLEPKSKDEEYKVNANLVLGIKAKVILSALDITNIISGYLEGGVDIEALFSLYKEQNGRDVKDKSGHADPQEATVAAEAEKFKFCFDVLIRIYIKGGLDQDNLIGKIAGLLNYDISKCSFSIRGKDDSNTFGRLPEFCCHFENSGYVDKCTRGDSEEDNDMNQKAASEGKFLLDSTKLNIEDGTCGDLKITGMPISEKKIAKNYVSGIQVRVKDESIAEAVYLESTNSIVVSAVKPGSTEIEVYVYKDKRNGKEYMQTFSVTISENPDMEYQSFTYDFFESPLGSKVIYYV